MASTGSVLGDSAVTLPAAVVHHRFTVEQYEEMVRAGILTKNDRVELICGEIIEKMTIGDRHAGCVNWLNRLFSRLFADSILVSIQHPIRLSQSVPEPDVALLRPRADFYSRGKPEPADILLLIEVSDTTLGFDRGTKRALYAAAGIAEFWIINLSEDCIEVYRQPQSNGSYASTEVFRRDQQLEIEALPGKGLAVGELLGPL